MFKRKIYDQLLEWKNTRAGEVAILIEGARRIGKSTVAEEFAKAEYDDYLLLDFSKANEKIKHNFRENMSNLDLFYRTLFLVTNKTLDPKKKCVIIFDEVQLFPPARQAIKTLVADGRFHFIETGSLISIKQNVQDILIPSEETRITMHPMDFEEFCWARGNYVNVPAIHENFANNEPFGDGLHRKLMRDFREYMAVGGMPQAVYKFVDGADYNQIDSVKREILSLYDADLAKYDKYTNGKAVPAFRSIPEQLTHQFSKFQLATVDPNWRRENARETLDFLEESKMVNACISVDDPDVLMELFANRDNHKTYMADTGLLLTQILRTTSEKRNDLYKAIVLDKLSSNQGRIVENMVAQILTANGHRLYYHEFEYPTGAGAKRYEVDFLLRRGRNICPVEVKSGGYKTHKSLDNFKAKYSNIKLPERFVVHTGDFDSKDGVRYIPLYAAICL